jgi:hypothetical protein
MLRGRNCSQSGDFMKTMLVCIALMFVGSAVAQNTDPQVASGLVAGGRADAPTGYRLVSAKYVVRGTFTGVCYTYRAAVLPPQYEVANIGARLTVVYHREGYWENTHGKSGHWEHDNVCAGDQWLRASELLKGTTE